MKIPKVSIIILNYNGLTDTKKCLNSLLNTKYPNFEVIIVDNGSTRDESLILKKKFKDKRFKFLRFKRNFGFSGGNNKAIDGIKSKYIALLNNDTTVTPDWLNSLIKTLEKENTIAIVQPKILWLKNKKYFDYSGACGGFIDRFGYPFTRGRLFNTIEKDKGQYNKPIDIFWASGAAFIVRKKIIDKLGFFDEIFVNYMEEIDFCFRVHKAGFRIVSQPKSIVYHKVAGTARKNMFKKRFWEHRNNLLMIIKNYPIGELLKILPQRIFFEYISIFYYVSIKKFSFAFAVIVSQFSILFMTVLILFKRSFKRTKYKYSYLKHGVFNKSIVFVYFLQRKKKFSELGINE